MLLMCGPRGNFATANLAQWENKGWWSTGLFRTLGQIVFFFINDLIKEDGSLLSLTDLKNNYNINIIFLDYYSIMLSIPQEWKSILRDNQIEKLDEICNKHILLLRVSQRVVKAFYKIFIQKVHLSYWVFNILYINQTDI